MRNENDNLLRRSFSAPRRKQRRRSAFSLLELLLVLAILIVIAALSAPAVQGTIGNQSIASGTDRVRVAMGQARVKAIRTGEVHALFFQRNGQWFDVAPLADHGRLTSQQTGDQPLTAPQRDLSENWLPRSVRFAAGETQNDTRSATTREDSGGPPVDAILFYPDGTSQDARLVLQDDRGSRMAVELRGLTGLAKTIRSVPSIGGQ